MATLASDLLRHFRLLFWNRWTEFNETWQEARSQRPLPSLCFSGRSEKQDGRPCLWLAETFSTSPLKSLKGIQRKLIGIKISTSSTKFVFFGPIGKTRWPHLPLIGWDIFDFFSETAERKSKKLDRKQDLNFLYQVCVYRADRQNKMTALAFDWLSHFRLLLRNYWTEFNETWQEARSQRPLPSLCFIGLIGKTRWRPWSLIFWDIFDFFSETAERNSMKVDRKQDLNVLYKVCVFRIDRKNKMAALASDLLRHFRLLLWNRWMKFNENSTGSKISTSSTKFVFLGWIGKTRWPPWFLICWDFLFITLLTRFESENISLIIPSKRVEIQMQVILNVRINNISSNLANHCVYKRYFSFSAFDGGLPPIQSPEILFDTFFVLRWATVTLWASCLAFWYNSEKVTILFERISTPTQSRLVPCCTGTVSSMYPRSNPLLSCYMPCAFVFTRQFYRSISRICLHELSNYKLNVYIYKSEDYYMYICNPLTDCRSHERTKTKCCCFVCVLYTPLKRKTDTLQVRSYHAIKDILVVQNVFRRIRG